MSERIARKSQVPATRISLQVSPGPELTVQPNSHQMPSNQIHNPLSGFAITLDVTPCGLKRGMPRQISNRFVQKKFLFINSKINYSILNIIYLERRFKAYEELL
jgi:hypothetical protein